jgi:hypothetical protein
VQTQKKVAPYDITSCESEASGLTPTKSKSVCSSNRTIVREIVRDRDGSEKSAAKKTDDSEQPIKRKRYTGRHANGQATAHTQLRQTHRGELSEKRGHSNNQMEDQSQKKSKRQTQKINQQQGPALF